MKKNNLIIIIILIVIAGVMFLRYHYVKNPQAQAIVSTNTRPKELGPEESKYEIFNNQPGGIQSIEKRGDDWIIRVDLLSPNTKWLPGVDSTGGFFINQNQKIRELIVSNNTKIYDCGAQYADGRVIEPRLENNSVFISKVKNTKSSGEFGYTAYFDIYGDKITAIHEQCLP